MDLKLHHIGICVDSIETSAENYKKLFGETCCSPIYTISTQDVKVCFVDTGSGVFLELVEPMSDTSGIHRLLKKGISYYHAAYKVSNIENSVTQLELLNYTRLDYFNSEAFNNKRCIFFFLGQALN